MFSGFEIDIVGNIFLFILLILTFIVLTIFSYLNTNPPIASWLRRLLIALRIITSFIVIFILFEPLLNITWQRKKKPIIAILVDTSASMGLEDATTKRDIETNKALIQIMSLIKEKGHICEIFQFSDKLVSTQSDTLIYDKDGTDISNALKELNDKTGERYLAGVVLLSDGIYNIGENPIHLAENYGVPIFPVAIGDPNEQKDVVISKIVTNQITYTNEEIPVEVFIRSSGYQDKRVVVNLKNNDNIEDTKFINLADNAMESKVMLKYVPKEPGYSKYTVQIPALADELTVENNTRNFYVKVLKSKMKLLLIAGSPGFDFSFMKRTLESDPNIEIDCWAQKNKNHFYNSPFPTTSTELKDYDCIILLDYPKNGNQINVIPVLKELIDNQNKPLLFMAGKNMNLNAIRPIYQYLPFNIQILKTSERLISFNLTSSGVNHSLMRFADNEVENQAIWNELPPVYYSIRGAKLTPGSLNLLEVNTLQSKIAGAVDNLPIIAVKKTGEQKTISILAYGLWRWDFLMQGIGKSNESYQKFISNCIRWLTTKDDNKLVRIVADKHIYRSGENITFTAETYYEDYRPLEGAEIKVYVVNDNDEYEVLLTSIGNGKYEGELQVLEGGDYKYTGQAFFQHKSIGEDSGRFSVEKFSHEFLNTKMNEDLLQQLAYKSMGVYYTSQDYAAIDTSLNFPQKIVMESHQFEIWNQLSLLIAVIVLLSVEWFIRKKMGML